MPGESAGPVQKPPAGYGAQAGGTHPPHPSPSPARPQSSATNSETPSTWTGTILFVARKGISDRTRRMNVSIKTYSVLKMYLFTTTWGRQPHLLFMENLDFPSPLLSLPLPSTTSNQTSYLGNNFDTFKNLRMINGIKRKTSVVGTNATISITSIKGREQHTTQSAKVSTHTHTCTRRHTPMGHTTQTVILTWKHTMGTSSPRST